MRRRTVLGGAAAASALTATPAIAEGTRELTMVTAWPRNTPGVGVNAQRFADRVTAMSGGRLQVKLFAAGELVPPFECLDAVARGAADMAHATPYYWIGKSEALHYFTGVPFGLLATEHVAWLRFGGGQALWDEVYAPLGVKAFYAGSSGAQAGGWFNREIASVDDFKGLKLRIAGLGADVLRRLGATPVLMPPGEIAPALMSGAVDGADWVGPWNDIAFGLQRAAKFYYMPGYNEPGPALEVLVRREVLDALPEDLRLIVETAAAASALETLADFTFHNVEAYAELAERHGVEVRTFPAPVVETVGATTLEVLEELGATNAATAKVHASFMGFLRRAARYAPAAEQGVLEMRTRVLAAG